MRLGIVMPTLDEAPALRRNLPPALAAADLVVVADGGSADGTAALAAELGARVVAGPAGRGGQLNLGAREALAAGADLLLFLHADTTLPPDGPAALRAAVAAGARGGAFLLRFDSERAAMRLGTRLVNLRTRWLRLPLGDQAQFATRETFERLGGFRDWPLLEDLDFAWRLRRAGAMTIVPAQVVTSARRFLSRGALRTVATNWLIWLLFLFGVSPRRLARLYAHIR
jgi:rSAM/selenodomain-associated transferase 2